MGLTYPFSISREVHSDILFLYEITVIIKLALHPTAHYITSFVLTRGLFCSKRYL
jgi:hypothetical protein